MAPIAHPSPAPPHERFRKNTLNLASLKQSLFYLIFSFLIPVSDKSRLNKITSTVPFGVWTFRTGGSFCLRR